jgi:PAS domain S-box-containing protein
MLSRPEFVPMAKQRKAKKSVRGPPAARKTPTKRKRAPADVDLKTENATLRRELAEALERQTAASEVLQVISGTPGDLEPVFKSMLENATRVCGANFGQMNLYEEGSFRPVAFYNMPAAYTASWADTPFQPHPQSSLGTVARTHQLVHIEDIRTLPPYLEGNPSVVELADLAGARTYFVVPMLRENELIGAITIYRQEVKPFTARQTELVANFAKQAVIAIENTRLLKELRQRTDDLTESLEQQTATSEVLQVISASPGDMKPVFESILSNALRICEAKFGHLLLYDGESFLATHLHDVPPSYREYWERHGPIRPGPNTGLGRLARTKQVAHIPDLKADSAYAEREPLRVVTVEQAGARSFLAVPMLKENRLIGAIVIYRKEVRPFTAKQIELVKNFAAQAVIAIENTRLLSELRESLQQQTATADVLKVISRSTFDLKTVLDTLVETVARLCRADQAHMFRRRDDLHHLVASWGLSEEEKKFMITHPFAPDRGTTSGRVVLERRAVHIPDALQDPEYTYLEGQKVVGFRTLLGIPLLREEVLIGVFVVARRHVEPFTNKEIELVTSFADQAVIAIENARLFDELRERQAELRVTFDNMGDGVAMFDAATRLAAWNRNYQQILDLPDTFLAERPSFAEIFRYLEARGEYGSADLVAELSRGVEDTKQEMRFERARPDGRVIEVRRSPVPGGGFVMIYSDITERKRAEQAIRAARDSAETALRDLQTAQDRLIQTEKLASLGQLTAGIAHEIKNPLNFINNFSALSVELVDELDDALKPAMLDNKTREETSELTQMLKGNLEKVVQHGQRADSIVKNMLLHSREGSGERRPVDLNSIVEDSLNLAYHGARAEKREFDIRLERSFDPAAGMADLFPQEITRVLLNLISNGVYAAMKRKAETRLDGYEAILTAGTKNLGDNVEIRIRDNGGGIPPGVREKIFNPFFTTKPPGEGTGLGLSLSHDIIVKQHSGSIEVDTQPGEFTEFRVILPRKAAPSKAGVNS